jgi:hypothetical protein
VSWASLYCRFLCTQYQVRLLFRGTGEEKTALEPGKGGGVALWEMIGRCGITPTRNVWRRGAIALCQESARRARVEDAGVRGRIMEICWEKRGTFGCIGCHWAVTYVVPDLNKWRFPWVGVGGEYLILCKADLGSFSTPVVRGFRKVRRCFQMHMSQPRLSVTAAWLAFLGSPKAAFVQIRLSDLPNAAACIEPSPRCSLQNR